MKLAVLFWCYKEADLCVNRLHLLRRHNPGVPIFALFGGAPEEAPEFEARLAPYVDDFYAFTEPRSNAWKWYYGDLMIAAWHRDRGRHLEWDTVVIVQWDMLVLAPLAEVFSELQEGEILLSGARPAEETRGWWPWTSGEYVPQYLDFLDHIRKAYGTSVEPMACTFIVVVLPRTFLDRYAGADVPELGFIEYRLPTYARAFGTPFSTLRRFDAVWAEDHARPELRRDKRILNGQGLLVPVSYIAWHLARPGGMRVFHPYEMVYPVDLPTALRFIAETVSPARHYRKIAHRAGTLLSRLSTRLRPTP